MLDFQALSSEFLSQGIFLQNLARAVLCTRSGVSSNLKDQMLSRPIWRLGDLGERWGFFSGGVGGRVGGGGGYSALA